ncbi:hypothetical protein ANPL_00820 [Anaplasma platys]|uniref:Uncharacterized protein n=1 Tax=Anaplasma platys TaxID=949 RepID=A0A858PXG6_9RICK|nr:hypothetical protein ANPL_00820 [Anaplasma platys]
MNPIFRCGIPTVTLRIYNARQRTYCCLYAKATYQISIYNLYSDAQPSMDRILVLFFNCNYVTLPPMRGAYLCNEQFCS